MVYIIMLDVNNGNVINNDPPVVRGHRLWKIADGIYLYEKW